MSETKVVNESKMTGQDFTLENGENVKLGLNFAKLNLLKKMNIELYNRFNSILYGKSEDILDLVTIIYVAYWCYNFNGFNNNELYKEDDFIELVGFDTLEIQRTFKAITQPKKKVGFRKPFIDKTGKVPKEFKIPKFELEDIEDYYTYYVLILGISEDIFWNADYNFLLSVVENKSAFDGFMNYVEYKKMKNNENRRA